MTRPLWIPWRWWRRIAQLAMLALFFYLFRRTEYSGSDQLPGGEELFFLLDPLAISSATLAARKLPEHFWVALITLALTLLFGRFFCGWICPLGTLLDYFHRLLHPLTNRTNRRLHVPPRIRSARYFLLALTLVAALFSLPLVGFLDPFSLLVRGLTFFFDPAYFRLSDSAFTWTDAHWKTQSLHQYFTKHLLPFRAAVFHTAVASAILLAFLFALEFVARRFWCRYLCPLGAGLGLLSRPSLVKRLPVKVCKSCGQCATTCRMGALDPATGFSPHACNLCMDCVDTCPHHIIKFTPKRPKSPPAPVDFSRRGLLTAAATGAVVPAMFKVARIGHEPPADPHLLRPPGAPDEKTFLSLCVRCGQCMKVCPTNVLQPAILNAGLEGMFSPYLLPRLVFEQTYCEYNCTLCGQVCPTGALPNLSLDEKHKRVTGKAFFDHSRCLPWAKETSCIRCEEMCPVPEKAIKVRNRFMGKSETGEEVEIHQPYVDRDLCVGCGICESNCPIEGPAGIRVRRLDSPDPGSEFKDRPKPTAESPTTLPTTAPA